MSAELVNQSIVALAAALESKKLSAVELTQAVIARTKAVEARVRTLPGVVRARSGPGNP